MGNLGDFPNFPLRKVHKTAPLNSFDFWVRRKKWHGIIYFLATKRVK